MIGLGEIRWMVPLGLIYLMNINIAFGGPKDEFVKAVIEQCKVSKDEAKKQVTPGRTGTVVRYRLCFEPRILLANGCTVHCKKGGGRIGK